MNKERTEIPEQNERAFHVSPDQPVETTSIIRVVSLGRVHLVEGRKEGEGRNENEYLHIARLELVLNTCIVLGYRENEYLHLSRLETCVKYAHYISIS